MERFAIARGAVANMRPVLLAFFAAAVGWVILVRAMIGAGAIASQSAVFFFAGGVAALAMSLLVYMNLPGRVEVGADGVHADWRGLKRYIAFADLADVQSYAESMLGKTIIGVRLLMRSGDDVDLPIGEDIMGAAERVSALATRIRARLDEYRGRDDHEDASKLEAWALASRKPTDDSLAWFRRLVALGEGANADHREAPIVPERLWRIVEDPSASPRARAGAAAALRPTLDEPGKARLRIAADATAAPRVRVAIRAAADESDDATAEALAALAQAEERRL